MTSIRLGRANGSRSSRSNVNHSEPKTPNPKLKTAARSAAAARLSDAPRRCSDACVVIRWCCSPRKPVRTLEPPDARTPRVLAAAIAPSGDVTAALFFRTASNQDTP
jgi:hypothetical protein